MYRDPQIDIIDFDTCMVLSGYPMPNYNFNWCDYPYTDDGLAWIAHNNCLNLYTEFDGPFGVRPDCENSNEEEDNKKWIYILIGLIFLNA